MNPLKNCKPRRDFISRPTTAGAVFKGGTSGKHFTEVFRARPQSSTRVISVRGADIIKKQEIDSSLRRAWPIGPQKD